MHTNNTQDHANIPSINSTRRLWQPILKAWYRITSKDVFNPQPRPHTSTPFFFSFDTELEQVSVCNDKILPAQGKYKKISKAGKAILSNSYELGTLFQEKTHQSFSYDSFSPHHPLIHTLKVIVCDFFFLLFLTKWATPSRGENPGKTISNNPFLAENIPFDPPLFIISFTLLPPGKSPPPPLNWKLMKWLDTVTTSPPKPSPSAVNTFYSFLHPGTFSSSKDLLINFSVRMHSVPDHPSLLPYPTFLYSSEDYGSFT